MVRRELAGFRRACSGGVEFGAWPKGRLGRYYGANATSGGFVLSYAHVPRLAQEKDNSRSAIQETFRLVHG